MPTLLISTPFALLLLFNFQVCILTLFALLLLFNFGGMIEIHFGENKLVVLCVNAMIGLTNCCCYLAIFLIHFANKGFEVEIEFYFVIFHLFYQSN
ncbi:unnamed protein product [Camellia sinensis]